jgi:hypothetical protein
MNNGVSSVPEYQHLAEDELLNIAEDRQHLTDEARLALDAELNRRKLSSSDVDSYRLQQETANKVDELKRAAPRFIFRYGFGQKFLGKSDRQRDPSGLFEKYDSTLWFVVLWFPIFPMGTYTVRRSLTKWLGIVFASDEVALERLPRNWEQILLTWIKAVALLFALRLSFLMLLRGVH